MKLLTVIAFFFTFFEITFFVNASVELGVSASVKFYDENLIVSKFLPMASAAYGEKDSNFKNCIEKAFGSSGELVNFTFVDCSEFNKDQDDKLCAAMIAVSISDKAVILSFRGTQDTIQYWDMVAKSFLLEQRNAAPAGKANSYFQSVVESFEKTGLFTIVKKTMEEKPGYKLWVTGASLGGALASLGAGLLVKKYQVDDKNMKLVTFAQPRTGNTEWAKAMDQIIPFKYRIVQGIDYVPHMPFTAMPSFGIGLSGTPLLTQMHDYLHFKGEVWYPDGAEVGGKYIMCDGKNEDENCSNKNYDVPKIPSIPTPKIPPISVPKIPPISVPKIPPVSVPKIPPISVPKIPPISVPKIPPVSVPDIDVEKEFNKVVDDGTRLKEDIERRFGNLDYEFQKFVAGADKLANDLYKCLSGVGNKDSFTEQIGKWHNTYFGKDFKYEGGRGCPNFQTASNSAGTQTGSVSATAQVGTAGAAGSAEAHTDSIGIAATFHANGSVSAEAAQHN